MRVSISAEHRILTIHEHQEVILVRRLPFASLCGFTWGPGLEAVLMGPFRFAIDRVIYQEEKEKGTGSHVHQQKVAFQGVGERVVRLIHFLVKFPK